NSNVLEVLPATDVVVISKVPPINLELCSVWAKDEKLNVRSRPAINKMCFMIMRFSMSEKLCCKLKVNPFLAQALCHYQILISLGLDDRFCFFLQCSKVIAHSQGGGQ